MNRLRISVFISEPDFQVNSWQKAFSSNKPQIDSVEYQKLQANSAVHKGTQRNQLRNDTDLIRIVCSCSVSYIVQWTKTAIDPYPNSVTIRREFDSVCKFLGVNNETSSVGGRSDISLCLCCGLSSIFIEAIDRNWFCAVQTLLAGSERKTLRVSKGEEESATVLKRSQTVSNGWKILNRSGNIILVEGP